MQHFQPFIAGQRLGLHAEALEVVENIRLNAFQLGLCGAKGVGLNTKGDVLSFEKSIVALGELGLQHIGILGADVVEVILLRRDIDLLLELRDVRLLVDEGELDEDGAVEVVEKVTPVLEDGGLVLVLGELVVDVAEPDGLGIQTGVDLANAIPAHLHIGDCLLGRLGDFLALLVLFLLRDKLLLFLSGKNVPVHLAVFQRLFGPCRISGCVVQSANPPFP